MQYLRYHFFTDLLKYESESKLSFKNFETKFGIPSAVKTQTIRNTPYINLSKPLIFRAEGPGVLKISTRLLYASEKTSRVLEQYQLKILHHTGQGWIMNDIFHFDTVPDIHNQHLLRDNNGFPVSRAQSCFIIVPQGKHKYRFETDGDILLHLATVTPGNYVKLSGTAKDDSLITKILGLTKLTGNLTSETPFANIKTVLIQALICKDFGFKLHNNCIKLFNSVINLPSFEHTNTVETKMIKCFTQYHLADIYLSQGKYIKARELLNTVLQSLRQDTSTESRYLRKRRDSLTRMTVYLLSKSYLWAGDITGSRNVLRNAIGNIKNDSWLAWKLCQLIETDSETGYTDNETLSLLRQLLKIDPHNPHLHGRLNMLSESYVYEKELSPEWNPGRHIYLIADVLSRDQYNQPEFLPIHTLNFPIYNNYYYAILPEHNYVYHLEQFIPVKTPVSETFTGLFCLPEWQSGELPGYRTDYLSSKTIPRQYIISINSEHQVKETFQSYAVPIEINMPSGKGTLNVSSPQFTPENPGYIIFIRVPYLELLPGDQYTCSTYSIHHYYPLTHVSPTRFVINSSPFVQTVKLLLHMVQEPESNTKPVKIKLSMNLTDTDEIFLFNNIDFGHSSTSCGMVPVELFIEIPPGNQTIDLQLNSPYSGILLAHISLETAGNTQTYLSSGSVQ